MNKKQLIIELAMPIVFALISIYIIVKAIPMEGEGVFPIMSAGVLLICAAYLLCVFIIRSLGYKKIGITVLCATLAVCATFFVFKVLLSVPLPMIFLDF